MEIKDRLRYELKYGAKQWWIDITDLVMDYFGDIVAKVEISNFYDCSENEAIEGTKVLIEKQKEYIKEGSGINFDAENMRITFVNGKQVEVWNSEWGGMRVPNISE